MNHKVGQWVFAIVVGIATAVFAYRWITDPAPRIERAAQESAVMAARTSLMNMLNDESLQIVDALAQNRKVGKAYVFRRDDGWEVSGYYRRADEEVWHSYLMALDGRLSPTALKIKDSDPGLVRKSAVDSRLEVVE